MTDILLQVGGSDASSITTPRSVVSFVTSALVVGHSYDFKATSSSVQFPFIQLQGSSVVPFSTIVTENATTMEATWTASNLFNSTAHLIVGTLDPTTHLSNNSTGSFTLSLRDLTTNPIDPDANYLTTTLKVNVGGSTTGTLEESGDVDLFAVALVAGQKYQFNLDSETGSSGLPNPALLILDPKGVLLSQSAAPVVNEHLHDQATYVAPTNDIYYLYVADGTSFGPSGVGNFTVSATNLVNTVNDSISKLFVGYYNRAPDPAGETYIGPAA